MALATAAAETRWQQLVDLETRIASVMGVLNATSAELVSLVAEVLGTDVWQGVGIRSPEHWLTWQCGLSSARAASLVATARGLGELPRCRERFGTGARSEDQARVIAQHTDVAHDAEVSELAPLCTVSSCHNEQPLPSWSCLTSDKSPRGSGRAPSTKEAKVRGRGTSSATPCAACPCPNPSLSPRTRPPSRPGPAGS